MFSRDPLRNPEILKPKTYSITPTVVRQVITFFLGLLIGLGTTYFLTWVANHHTLQFTDGSTIGFGFYGGTTFITFCISLFMGIYWQHENLTSFAPVKQTWKSHIPIISSFSGFMTLLTLLMMEPLSALFLILYQAELILLLFLVVVNVQEFVLKRMAFDENDHRWLMKPEANFWACKAGVLPYREKLESFWSVISSIVFLIFFTAFMLLLYFSSLELLVICLLFSAIFGFLGWQLIVSWQVLNTKKIYRVEGEISKSMKPGGGKTPPTYIIQCEDINHLTEAYLWYAMNAGSRYKLWYITFGRKTKMVAFEKIPEPQPVMRPASMPQKAGCLPKLFQLVPRGREPKQSKLPESH